MASTPSRQGRLPVHFPAIATVVVGRDHDPVMLGQSTV